MAVAVVALVPEAFMEVTVRSSDVQHPHSGRRQKTSPKNSVQGGYGIAASLGRLHCHPCELLSRLDRGEEAWVPPLQSSDESADEGPVKPTLKQLPSRGAWWDRYRSPVTYPSSESANSDNDQESEKEKPHRGGYLHRDGFRLTILRRNVFSHSKGSGSNNPKPKEAYKHGSQLKKPSQSQLGKTKAETGNAHENSTKERAAGKAHEVSCPDCGQIFKSKISLANHQRIHIAAKAYQCSHCEEKFTSKKTLDYHQMSHTAEARKGASYSVVKHQNKKLYECLACKKSFKLKQQLLLHQKSHATQQSHKGPECGETFVQKEPLDQHQNCHPRPKGNRKKDKKEEKTKGMPETAGKKGSTAPVPKGSRPLNIGLTRQQQDQVNVHKCQFCGKCLRFKSLLVDHERMHREGRPHKCSQCSKSFLYKSILMSHMMTHMKQASKKHPKKAKRLTVKSAWVNSESSRTGESSSKCPVSRKIITRNSQRIRRPRKQAQKTPYQCQYCGKCLTKSIILADHEKLHTNERPYKCHKCTESFIRKYHLFRHLENHHGLSNDDVKRLRIKSHHAFQEGIHHGQKASEGLLPARDVTRHSGLAKHPKISTQENYVCQHCGKCMRTKSSFVNHGKIHMKKQQPHHHLERGENASQEKPLASHQETHMGKNLPLSSNSKDKMITEEPPNSLRVPQRSKKPYLCQKCGKTFDDNYSFTRHQRIHSGLKPFKCPACGKAFIQMWHLKRHEKTHLKGKFPKQPVVREAIHESQDRKLFKCSLCGKGFFQAWHLKWHKRIHQNEECRKLSAIMEVTRAFSNLPSGAASKEEGRGDHLGKALPPLPPHTVEVSGLPRGQEGKRDPLVALEERPGTGAREMHIATPVELSRKSKENISLGYGKVRQAEKPERKPRRKDTFSIHQPRAHSKNAHSQSRKKEKNHTDCPLRPRASSGGKSKREVQLVGKRSKRSFCQREERETLRPNTSNPARKVKYCDGCPSDPWVGVSSSLFQGASKPEGLCLKLPCQKTFSRGAQMKVTGRCCVQGNVDSVAHERESLEASSDPRSCEKGKCKPSKVRDLAEIWSGPQLSKRKTQQGYGQFCPLNGCSNASTQNLGTAPLAQQLEEMQKPQRTVKAVKGRRSVELQRAILRKLQKKKTSKRKAVCDQQTSPMEHVCTHCKKSFRSRTNLLVHEKNHTEDRPFPCIQCKKSFFSVTALKVHMRIHTGEKPFQCSECDFCCNVLCNLNRHKASHSQGKLHPCLRCGKSFWLNPKLSTHLKFSGKKKAYACPSCERASAHMNLPKRKRKKF